MKIGTILPYLGPPDGQTLSDCAQRAEQAGFDSVWVNDHVVMVRDAVSPYPYSADGAMTWAPDANIFDSLISMAMAAARTERVEVGVAVLIAPMRNPVVMAKQLATLDYLSGGRVVLGVGAGWLAEEFEALEAPFADRGARLDEWIDLLRECWTGTPSRTDYAHYRLPPGVLCYPTPARPIPILVGGMSRHAQRRAGRVDGWIPFQWADSMDFAALRAGMETMRRQAESEGRRTMPQTIVRFKGANEVIAGHLPHLASIGVSEIIVETDWQAEDGPQRAVEVLRNAD